jgi:hypothetical protein
MMAMPDMPVPVQGVLGIETKTEESVADLVLAEAVRQQVIRLLFL